MTKLRRAMVGVVLALTLPIFLACNDSPSEPTGEVGFQTVLKALRPGNPPDLQGRETIRDQATWQGVWSDLHGGLPPALPEVDFRFQMVVLVSGPGCHGDTEISSISREGAELVVRAQSQACSNTICFAPDFTVHVVRLARFDGPVRFIVMQDLKIC